MLNGLVLVGGQSSRMGFDKALADYHGMPQAGYAYALLAGVCERVYLSVRAGQELATGLTDLPALHDRYENIGPLAGVLSAMEAHPKAAWLVLGCDMPNVDARVIQALLAGRDSQRQATVFLDGDVAEPLCAIYEPSARPVLQNGLRAGQTGLRHLLAEMDVQWLELPFSDALCSINTPQEAERYRTARRP